jgi:hypothetical protein
MAAPGARERGTGPSEEVSLMRRRRWLALVAGAGALLLTPVMAGAAPLTSAQVFEPVGFFRLCAEAQVEIGNIDEAAMTAAGISVGGTIYASRADFELSKSGVDIDDQQIVTVGLTEYRDAERTEPYLVRCKLRTGESLNEGAWPPGEPNNSPRFEVDPYFGFGAVADGVSLSDVDQPCSAANQNTIDAVWGSLTPEQQAAAQYDPTGGSPTLVTVPDIETTTGPGWLQAMPPLEVNGSTLQLRSRSLIVLSSFPGPRFAGAHYCTLVAPEYLRDVLLGVAEVV